MTARASIVIAACWGVCLLLGGCAQTAGKKKADGFTDEDRKFFREAEAKIDGKAAPAPNPTPAKQCENFMQIGQFYLGVKKVPLAERMFEKALANDSKCIAAYAGLARCRSEVGETQKAAEMLNKGFAIDPKSAILWNEAAVLRARTGDLEGAVEAAQKAAHAAPKVLLYAENLGNLLAVTGDYQNAFEVYAKALNPAEAHYRIALVMRDKGNMRSCDQHLRQALAANPEHAAARKAMVAMNGDAVPAKASAVQRAAYETSDDVDQQVEPAAARPNRRTSRPTSQQLGTR